MITLDGTMRPLDPRVRTVWVVSRLVLIGVPGVACVIVALALGSAAVAGVVAVVTAVLAASSVVWTGLRWRQWRWAAWPDGLELQHGVVFRQLSLVPYHRIQQIDVHRGPIERLIGLSTLVIRTAAATTDGQIPGVAAEEAEGLRHQLLAVAGVDDAV